MRRIAAVVTATLLLAPASAAAHVQVRPADVAPGDAVLFEVLVPGERDVATTKVVLKVPPGVIPFSYEDAPGWKRTVQEAADGSTDTITWRGRLATDGFARFGFLASTPERESTLSWKATQTYADGEVARWIGAKDSEEPAATTRVSRTVAAQNAGGESAGVQAGAPAAAATPAQPTGEGGDERDPLALGLGGAGLILGAIALLVALRRRG